MGYSNKVLWKTKYINGWFKTGDLGSIDKDGFFVFQGRDADNININGVNYNLKNIEEDLKVFKIKNLKILNIKKIAHFDHKFIFIWIKKLSSQFYIFKKI